MRANALVVRGSLVALAAVLAGCSAVGTGGGPRLASVPAVPAPDAPVVVPVNYGGFLDGPTGARLPAADRTAALEAEDGAISSGERRTWKGARGVYGFVVPGPAAPGDGSGNECRSFTHTIYFAGRPQFGKGTGCRDADGSWHVTS